MGKVTKPFQAIAVLALVSFCALAQAKGPQQIKEKKIDRATHEAIAAMKSRAAELKMAGVAVVAFAPGDSIQDWSSKMAVVGRMTDPQASAHGNNLLAIAYAKASEMAETLKDSGTAGKPPMTGEFGWQGGVIGRVPAGYVIVAFSGGKSEDDVEVSKAGLAVMKSSLP